MSAEKKYNFEQLVKEKLESYSPESSSGWNNFEQKLNQAGSKSLLKSPAYYIVASVIVAVSLYFGFFNDPDKPNNPIKDTTHNNLIIPPHEEKTLSEKLAMQEENEDISNNNTKEQIQGLENETQKEQTKTYKEENTADDTEAKEEITAETNPDDKKPAPEIKTPVSAFSIVGRKGCAPFEVTFTPEEIASNIIYMWEFGDGHKSHKAVPTHTYEKPGNYSVSLTVKYYRHETIKTNIKENLVYVMPTPELNFIYKKKDEWGKDIIFTALCPSGKYSYRWDFGDESEISETEKPEHEYTKTKDYNVTLVAENSYGCKDSVIKIVPVHIKHKIFMPEAFSPNNDGKNDEFGPHEAYLNDYTIQLTVSDKYGKIVFESTEEQIKWNGKIRKTNKKAECGIYYWTMISIDKNNNKDQKSGTVRLLN